MKKASKKISLMLSVVMLIVSLWPSSHVSAKEISDYQCRSITLNDGSYISIKETPSIITSDYFENGVKKQSAVLTKESGEILYREYDNKKIKLGTLEFNGPVKDIKTEKYNIQDFKLEAKDENQISLKASGKSFNYLMSKTIKSGGQSYYRLLYGYKDTKAYKEGDWLFKAGTAISVISVALLVIPELGSKVIEGIVTVGGFITQKFGTEYIKKDHYWVYKFVQSRPTSQEFICSNNFVYKTEHIAITTDNKTYWVTEYEKSSADIAQEREDILNNPGLYH